MRLLELDCCAIPLAAAGSFRSCCWAGLGHAGRRSRGASHRRAIGSCLAKVGEPCSARSSQSAGSRCLHQSHPSLRETSLCCFVKKKTMRILATSSVSPRYLQSRLQCWTDLQAHELLVELSSSNSLPTDSLAPIATCTGFSLEVPTPSHFSPHGFLLHPPLTNSTCICVLHFFTVSAPWSISFDLQSNAFGASFMKPMHTANLQLQSNPSWLMVSPIGLDVK